MAFFLRPGYYEDHADEYDNEWDGDAYEDDPDDYIDYEYTVPTHEEIILWRRHGLDTWGYFIPTCRIYQIPHRCRIYNVYLCADCGKSLSASKHRDCLPF